MFVDNTSINTTANYINTITEQINAFTKEVNDFVDEHALLVFSEKPTVTLFTLNCKEFIIYPKRVKIKISPW